jgi:hypothetical protein
MSNSYVIVHNHKNYQCVVQGGEIFTNLEAAQKRLDMIKSWGYDCEIKQLQPVTPNDSRVRNPKWQVDLVLNKFDVVSYNSINSRLIVRGATKHDAKYNAMRRCITLARLRNGYVIERVEVRPLK